MSATFDTVFYSEPVPSSFETLTLLSLLFDKVYFPGVYIGYDGLDEMELKKEIQRISALNNREPDSLIMLNCMRYALHMKYIEDFCVFPGQFGYCGILEAGADELARKIEESIFGPPPPNFTPMFSSGFAKGLPGNDTAVVNGPSWLTYPANALIYSMNNELPLINDNPYLPVPGMNGVSLKNNASLLSTILAFESLKLILPKVPIMGFEEIGEFREETKTCVRPFRMEMLKLSKELNKGIQADTSIKDIQREAKFIAETTVQPTLEELRQIIEKPAKPWHRRTVDFVKSLPELATNFFTLPPHMAVARGLSKGIEVLADIQDDQLMKEEKAMRGGMYYLLKVESRMKQHP